MKQLSYTVTSETACIKSKRPDLCWMDIPENKLQSAVSTNGKFQIVYHHHEEGVYICSYIYSVSARELNLAFDAHRSIIYNTYTKAPFFRFYLDYAGNKIYAGTGKESQLVFELPKARAMRLGEYALKKAIETIRYMEGDLLVNLVASTAIWAPMDAVMAQKNEDLIRVRMKSGQKKGLQIGDYILDDNTYINGKMKRLVKKYLHFMIPAHEYHVCHIWPTSHEDPSYHSDIRNIILLPSAIYSLSDHDDSVKAALKYRAYKLFGNWTPGNELPPSKPSGYEKIEWLNLPTLSK